MPGLSEEQRRETLELIRSALAEGLGFGSDAERWLTHLESGAASNPGAAGPKDPDSRKGSDPVAV